MQTDKPKNTIEREVELISHFYTKHPDEEGLKTALIKLVDRAKEEGCDQFLESMKNPFSK